ncbi:hypothetical protein [Sphingomicrobium sediminis]|uniref:Uncharacterized protein n=1 Tax=Sphingomicrobium sediminis TaxID=2950949 RepID=A0A9X2J4F6_9SPHN|nr:hypothetical protein [Sphingomicrobium sediminis]MCM8558311.1 hypothetical protein [Sphingomicrobium sediminis]
MERDHSNRLTPDELRSMADTSADPIIRRALENLAEDVEQQHQPMRDDDLW